VSLIKHLLENNQAKKIRVLDNLSVGTREDLGTICDFSDLSPQSPVLDANGSLSPQSSVLSPEVSPRSSIPVELVVGDIRNAATAEACCEGMDIVVHLAANTGVLPSVEDPRADMESNVIGTFNMLEASRLKGVQRFIFASSGAPLGEVEPPINEEKAPRPVSPYGAGKLAGEGYCSAYYRTFGLKTVSLRFGNVYGPRSRHKNSVIAKFFKQALNGKTLEIYGDGNQTRDFIYIDDLIQAICLAVTPKLSPQSLVLSPEVSPQPSSVDSSQSSVLSTQSSSVNSPQSSSLHTEPWGEVFQIATCRETTVNEIAHALKDLVESETGRKVNIVYGQARPGDVKRNYSDISKAKMMLGYELQYDLNKGLKKTLDYFLGSR
jgi:UDP-glucose 4-epimerase